MSSQASAALRRLPLAPPPNEADQPDLVRPRTRGDCVDGPRPCPWVSCRHHLGLDVSSKGEEGRSIQVNGEGRETYLARYGAARFVSWSEEAAERVLAMPETCSLDVAEQGGRSLDQIGQLLGVTREGARLIELNALGKVSGNLREFASDD